MPRIKIVGEKETFTCTAGENLLQSLKKHGVYVDNPCGGRGTCGKCKVRLTEGSLGPWQEGERDKLSEKELEEGFRLACLCAVRDDITIALPEKAHYEGLVSGESAVYQREMKRNHFSKGELGAAIDLGTTTVAAALIDLETGNELGAVSGLNAQAVHGLDVLSRITYETEEGERAVRELQHLIVDQLNDMLFQMLCKIEGKSIREESGEQFDRTEQNSRRLTRITVSGNCTMLHMLLGVSAKKIGRAPYEPEFLEEQEIDAKQIGLAFPNAKLICLPSISAYVGGDITSGLYAAGIESERGNLLFIDIGTNGEMALKSNGRYLACSCAAGPALEGMNISNGMRASRGAIEDLAAEGKKLCCTVIGTNKASGICGSGILAAVRTFLKTGMLLPGGNILKTESLEEEDWRNAYLRKEKGKRSIWTGCGDIAVTQSDIRQVQLAKGALLSGIQTLFERSGLCYEECDKVIVAGQFGKHLPEESLIETGILPEAFRGKISYAGNTSLEGAKAALLSDEAREAMKTIAGTVEYFELGTTEGYEALFIKSLRFP